MNIPNFASCHHAIRCARVAASSLRAGDFCKSEAAVSALTLIAPDECADEAIAPATPRCFRNDRLETTEVFMCFLISPSCRKPKNGRRYLRGKVYAEKVAKSSKEVRPLSACAAKSTRVGGTYNPQSLCYIR